ncbi:MAG: FecR domain-containing protein [Sphingobacterium sp.]|jgi:ferric-dicitrate binding protein FerR (iron transport regulator)|nr:FecR domain-containing protein [Sphingobacterium sp.]
MRNTRLGELFTKYFDKTATDTERTEFFNLLSKEKDEERLLDLLQNLYKGHQDPTFSFERPALKERILFAIDKEEKKKQPIFKLATVRWVAAALLLVGFSLYLLQSKNSLFSLSESGTYAEDNSLSQQGVLTLVDGSRILLDTLQAGSSVKKEGMTLSKSKEGHLTYHFETLPSSTMANSQKLNTITVPRGKQYQIHLNDGTSIWLNAESQLRFPQLFSQNSRDVFLEGEGYFDVAKDSNRPFNVQLREGLQVKVLGTQFNVDAYNKDIMTTLLQGEVMVSVGRKEVRLRPGQQIIANPDTRVISSPLKIDTEQVIAWKDGFFSKSDILLSELIEQIQRWYDVEIIFDKENDFELAAKIPRNIPLQDLLDLLNMTKRVTCKLDGKTIKIEKTMPK